MKKYVKNLEIKNGKKVKREILNWKYSVIKGIDLEKSKKLINIIKILNYLEPILAFISTVLFIYPSMLIYSEAEIILDSTAYFWYNFCWKTGVFLTVSFFVIIAINISVTKKYKNERALDKLIKNVRESEVLNPCLNWLPKIIEEIKLEERPVNYSKMALYEKYKFYLKEGNETTFKKEYEVAQGTIFNNPFELSVGVLNDKPVEYVASILDQPTNDIELNTIEKKEYAASTTDAKIHTNYLPLLRVKTNLFKGEIINITNAKNTNNFKIKDIQLENDEFNKKFSIQSTSEASARMILTPLAQQRLIELNNKMYFNLIIADGYIDILFLSKTVQKKHHSSGSFMDNLEIQKVEMGIKLFDYIDKKIWHDMMTFVSALNIIFSISIIQFEEVIN